MENENIAVCQTNRLFHSLVREANRAVPVERSGDIIYSVVPPNEGVGNGLAGKVQPVPSLEKVQPEVQSDLHRSQRCEISREIGEITDHGF